MGGANIFTDLQFTAETPSVHFLERRDLAADEVLA